MQPRRWMWTKRVWTTLACVLMLGGLPACEQEQPYEGAEGAAGEAGEPLGYAEPETGATPAANEQQTQEETSAVLAMPLGVNGNGALQLERLGTAEARAGEVYQYRIRVTNTSDQPLHNVVVTEYLPANFQVYESTPQFQPGPAASATAAMPPTNQAQANQAQQTGQRQGGQGQARQAAQGAPAQGGQAQGYGGTAASWRLGMLMPDQSQTITVSGAAQSEGAAESCIVVDYQPAICTTVNFVQPQLALERAVVNAQGEPVEQAYICEELFVAYRLTNTGSGTADAIVLAEDLPNGVLTEGESRIRLEAGALEAGETFEEVVPLTIEQPVTLDGFAVARTADLEIRSPRQAIRIIEPELQLQVRGPQQATVGDPVEYTVTVTNTSDVPAPDVAVRLSRPQGATQPVVLNVGEFTETEEGVALGTLSPGQRVSFTAAMEVDEPGQVGLSAEARGYCAAAQSRVAQTQVVGIPAVLLSVVDNNDPVELGETTIYEITVKNQGSAEDLNVQLQAQMPQGMEFVQARGDTQVRMANGRLQFQPIDSLPPGEVVSWLVQARAVQPGSARLQVQLVSDANQRPVIAQEPTTLY